MPKQRGNGDGSYRVLPTGTHEGRQMVNGQRLTAYGRTRDEARAKLRAKAAKARMGVVVRDGNAKLGSYLAAWIATAPGNTPKGRAYYAETVKNHLIPKLGERRLSELRPSHVEAMMRAGLAAGLSARTVTIHRNVLRAALNVAVGDRLIPDNAAAVAKPPPGRGRKARPLTLAQADKLLAITSGTRQHAFYAVALATGLRQGELLGLRWEDVDLAAGLVHVRRQAQREKGRGIALVDLKTDSSQASVPLARFAAFALVAHRERQREERELAGRRWKECGLVFPSTVGTPQGAPNVLRRWWRDCDALAIERRPFHDLRHTTATLLFARDVPMATIQRILRHARLSTTADIYTEIFDEALTAAAGAIDQAFSGERLQIGWQSESAPSGAERHGAGAKGRRRKENRPPPVPAVG